MGTNAPPGAVDRRTLIQGTGLASLAAWLPAVGRAEALSGGWHGRPMDVALGIAQGLFGQLGDDFPNPTDTHFRDELRRFLVRLDAGLRDDLLLLMRVVEYGPPLIAGHFGWFSNMAPARQATYLAAWPDHWAPPIRTGGRALKLIFAPLYFSDPATWTPLGYDGPWIGRTPMPHFELPPVAGDAPIDEVLP